MMQSYSDELILSIRTSEVFRTSVYFIDFMLIIAIGTTILAVHQLDTRKIFTPSTNYLLIFDFVAINIHNLSYVMLQNWSLFRSFYWSTNADEVMFRSEECWPYHVANEYTKTVTLFVQFAFIINRITVTLRPRRFSKAKHAVILSTATMLISALFTANEHARGPLLGEETTSCFRESDVTVELQTEHVGPYITICTATIVCSLCLIVSVKISHKKKIFDVSSQYMRRECMISTVAVVIIGLIQLAAFSFYDIMITIFAYFAQQNQNEHDTNIIGWLYTGPFNAVATPSAVLFYILIIKKNRQKEIKSLTMHTVSHNDYFQQLGDFWNKN